MSICPKCGSPVEAGATKCTACGVSLKAAGGTLNLNDLDSLLHADKAESLPTSVDSTSTSTTPNQDSTSAGESTDLSETLNTEEVKSEDAGTAGTISYSDSMAKEARGSAGGSGSEGRLKRVWDAAIGSSGKDSKQSLRYERPEASDSVFTRVATRNVADANSEGAEEADYQIRDKVGEGAMGIVYSAIQTAVSRLVAIKTIKADASKDQTARKRFFYEASITADLDHPNIPPIYELGVSGEGIVFYSMKLIAGSEWQKVIKSRALAENLEIFNRVADAVAFAHSKNIIHRDLKPDNVIIGNYGEVYVTDWGLAVNIQTNPRVPFGGTPDYMAPEMASDRRDSIGKHSDIYLLGAVLFQILSGKSPHAGRNQRERLNLAVANTFVETDCKDPLLDVAYQAMNTQPADRFASVAEMQAAIREILAHNDSIELSHRSAELAKTAAETKNYDTFNRAIFGYRDAIDLWSENDLAKQGLQDARIAYGLCALDRGNYDLALQTLDEKNPRETAIYGKAKKAKIATEQKDARFKLFRRAAATVGAALLLALSAASLWAYRSQQSALNSAVSEKAALEQAAEAAKGREEEARGREEAQAKLVDEEKAKTKALELAQSIRDEKLAGEEKARLEKEISDQKIEKQEQQARESEKLLLMTERNAALEKQKAAEIAAAQIELASQPQKFNLAVSQIRQNDIQSANILLEQIRNSKLEALEGNTPNFKNWAADRIALLSNADLPKQSLGGPVTAIDFAPAKNIGVAGNAKGDVVLLEFEKGKLVEKNIRKSLGAQINAVVIAPDASLAMIATQSNDKKHELYQWNLASTSEPARITETENRSFQGLRFSPDGSTVLAGINHGLWAKSGNGDWKRVSSSNQEDVRGELLDITWVSPTQVLVLARLNKAKYLHLADVKTGKVLKLDVSVEDTERMTSIASIAPNRLMIGGANGSLETVTIEGSKFSTKKDLPRRHQTSIDRISSSGTGKFITRGNEPVAHVWSIDGTGNVQYETFLTGAPGEKADGNNIAGTAFIDTNNVVAVDTAGNAVALNIERQKQRRQITRRSAQGLVESYPVPVVGVHSRGKSSNAIAVNQDGIVDMWNLQNGETISTKERWSYFGHTPGAVIVDSQVDADTGVLITAATLRDAQRSYLSDPSHLHEYCFWDGRTGNMIRRWTDTGNDFSQPRISIIEPGRLLTSSDTSKIIDYSAITNGGAFQFPAAKNLTDKSPEFSIVNPKNPKVVAMVSPTGALFLWDKTNEIRNKEEIGSRGELPLQAVWSEDGERLYVVVTSGKIYRCSLAANGFQKPQFVANVKTKDDSRLLTSHHDIDILIDSANGQDSVYCVTRSPANTVLLSCTVSKDGKVSKEKREQSKELAWLDGRSKKLTSQFGSQKVNRSQRENIVSASRIGNQVYVTTKREGVFQFSDDDVAKLVGLQSFVGSTADREGNFVWTLRSDGSVLRFAVNEGEAGKWERMPFSFAGARRLEASPDGKFFAVLGKDTLDLVNSSDGKLIEQFKSTIEFAWHPKEDQMLGMLTVDGGVFVRGTAKQIAKVSLGESSVRSIGFFEESWSDPSQKSNRYLIVHSEANERGKVHFVPVDAKNDGDKEPELFVGELPKGSRLAISPKDSLLATGDTTGAIRIWFALPAYKTMDALYDLESERDTSIRHIVFADDGDTLVTSDDKSRLVGWLSKDKWTPAKP